MRPLATMQLRISSAEDSFGLLDHAGGRLLDLPEKGEKGGRRREKGRKRRGERGEKREERSLLPMYNTTIPSSSPLSSLCSSCRSISKGLLLCSVCW